MNRNLLPTGALALVLFGLIRMSLPAADNPAAAPDKTPLQLKRGDYIVNQVGLCIDCHSPRDEKGALLKDRQLRGSPIGFAPTVRPVDKLTLELTLNREWLDVAGGRLYSANVERLKGTYSFSAKSLLRVIGQYVTTTRYPALYSFNVGRYSGSFLGSILYSYKLNWQTVLFAGYGDDRLLTANNDLVKLDRSLFFKISYAFQR